MVLLGTFLKVDASDLYSSNFNSLFRYFPPSQEPIATCLLTHKRHVWLVLSCKPAGPKSALGSALWHSDFVASKYVILNYLCMI